MPRCKAKTTTGDQCRNNAIPGTSFCYISSHGKIRKTRWQRSWNLLRNKWQAAVALISLPLTLFGALGVYWYLRDSKRNATSGVVSSSTQAAALSISVGSAEFRMLSKDGVVFDEAGVPLLSIRLLNGKLLVTTRVRDANGSLIAEMSDNEWTHQSKPAIFDRNYTENALEIRDSAGRVVLQVADLGNTINVAAVFHCKNGWTYLVGPLAGGSGVELRPPGEPLTSQIPTICDYPSELHFGSCPGIERLRNMTAGHHPTVSLYFPIHFCSDFSGPRRK
jgi:hypothetical protein